MDRHEIEWREAPGASFYGQKGAIKCICGWVGGLMNGTRRDLDMLFEAHKLERGGY